MVLRNIDKHILSYSTSQPRIPCGVYEVLTAVVMKSSVFWDITLCGSLDVNRRFGGTCRLHV
jgi:hypothetical protein